MVINFLVIVKLRSRRFTSQPASSQSNCRQAPASKKIVWTLADLAEASLDRELELLSPRRELHGRSFRAWRTTASERSSKRLGPEIPKESQRFLWDLSHLHALLSISHACDSSRRHVHLPY